MRSLFLLPLALAACTTLSTDERQQLANYQRNAQLYLEGGRLEQALQMVERGLEIDPDDYKLRFVKGAILLRESGPVNANDQQKLDESRKEFAAVYAMRSPRRHEPHLLFLYALTRQKQGMRLCAEAARLPPGSDSAAQAVDFHRQADEEFAASKSMLELLLDRGEVPRLCHYHLLQLAAARGDDEGVLEHGKHYLEVADKDQKTTKAEIDRTPVFDYESWKRRELQTLREEEIEVRTFVADRLFNKKKYDEALAQVDAVLLLDPTRSADHYNRSRILQSLGRVEESKSDLRKFLATTPLPPDNPKVVDAVKALSQ